MGSRSGEIRDRSSRTHCKGSVGGGKTIRGGTPGVGVGLAGLLGVGGGLAELDRGLGEAGTRTGCYGMPSGKL